MAPRRASTFFGFTAPNLSGVVGGVMGEVQRKAQPLVTQAQRDVAAVRQTINGVDRAIRAEMEAHGLGLPARRSAPSSQTVPRKVVSTPPRQPSSTSAPAYAKPSGSSIGDRVVDAALQVDTAVRGAADVIMFGKADEFSAGASALVTPDGRPFKERYDEYLAIEQARDRYDASHRGAARTTGQVAGLGLSVATGHGAGKVRAAAPVALTKLRSARVLGNVPRLQTSAREVAVASGAGGVLNGAGEAVSGILTGDGSKPADALGAMVGGAVTVPILLARSPARAGAAEGFVTSIAQDMFNGRPISLEDALRSGSLGATTGVLGDKIGTGIPDNLSSQAKGKLGEALSSIKTRARGGQPIGSGERLYLKEPVPIGNSRRRKYTDLDPASSREEFVESKFGPTADLSDNQIQAYLENPGRYRIDHWLAPDIGKIFGFGSSSLGNHFSDRDYREYQP